MTIWSVTIQSYANPPQKKQKTTTTKNNNNNNNNNNPLMKYEYLISNHSVLRQRNTNEIWPFDQ